MTATRETSMQRFKRMTVELMQEIRSDAISELNASADQLVLQMQAVAPTGPTGNLKRSIRKEAGGKDTRVTIKAGGALTTVKHGSAPPYDYTNAVEFGTEHNSAQPFFWPSWRLRRKRIRSSMRRKITANIKKRSAE